MSYQQDYYQANRERLLEKQKAYYRANREKIRAYQKEWRTRNPRWQAFLKENARLKTRYGIDIWQRERMYDNQKGLCAICRIGPAEHVDHDHDSGAVRALLCFSCNIALGKLRDDPAIVDRAAAYLRSFSTGGP